VVQLVVTQPLYTEQVVAAGRGREILRQIRVALASLASLKLLNTVRLNTLLHMIKQYIKENWDGWPLHGALAALFFWAIVTFDPPTVLLILNTIFWPDREATQHKGYANIWTMHRIGEWGVPLLVGFIAYFLIIKEQT